MKTDFRRTVRLCAPGLRPGSLSLVRAAGAGFCLTAGVACAQTSAAQLDPVVVSATRSPVPLSHVLSDVSVIQREDIERHGSGGVVDVLRGVAGVQMVRNGGPAGTTSVFIRGGEQRFTAVMVDGVRVDTQTTGGVSWEAIPLSQIERIEIVRGPASALYGSDAMGGVVQIFTRKGTGGAGLDAGLGVGSHHTAKSDATFSGASGPLDFALSAASESSHGFDSTVRSATATGADRDGYWSRSVSGRLGFQLADAHRVEVSALDNRVRSQYDAPVSSFSPFVDNQATRDLQTLRALWSAQWTQGWRSALSAGQSDDAYEAIPNNPTPYRSFSRVQTYAWQNDVSWGANSLQAILERRQDRLRNDLDERPIDDGRSQDAIGLGYGWRDAGRALQLQLRRDDDSEFGGHSTGSIASGLDLAPGWRLQSSFGTGFRAPTLYQRFSEYGSASLAPESSRNFELGLQRSLAHGQLSLTAFHNRVTDLIVFGGTGTCASDFGCYANSSGVSELSGLTLQGRHAWRGWRTSGSFDFLSAKNTDTDKWLARRARRTASLQLDKDLGDWTLGAQWLGVGRRFDDAANKRTLGGYGVLNLDAQWRIDPEWRLQVRVDNLFDKDYNTANNFVSAPLSLFVGMRWSPKL